MQKKYKMKLSVCFLAISLLLCAANAISRDIPAKNIPTPSTVSVELQKAMSMESLPGWPWNVLPKDNAEWKQLVEQNAAMAKAIIPDLLKKLDVKCTKSEMGGIPVFIIEPSTIPDQNRGKILMGFHGGGYVYSPGEAGIVEGLYLASTGKFKVISVDYRMPPEFPFPAALDDAVKAYSALLRSYSPKNIGVFGTSAGGGLTLALCLRLKEDGIPLPGAIAAGTPWSDLSKTGDSYFTNSHLDNVLVEYDGLLGSMAKLYANGHDLKNPFISPVYGDLHGFPPTILGTGTRDLFLSNAARVHRKLREAQVPADLLIIEGLSHAQYMLLQPDAPECLYYFREVAKFFEKYLGK